METALSTRSDSAKTSHEVPPWQREADVRNVRAVDREFEELLKDAKRQDEEDDDEESEAEDEEQEASTEASVIQYDELR